MQRDIEKDLHRWKQLRDPMPLLIRGARQVGKSHVIEKFGKENFDHFVLVNLEQHPEYIRCFDTLEPQKIINSIELVTGSSIHIGKTLLFIDEIQESPRAILALRYFKEQMPKLHVIGAGSLLEFVINDENFRMPVGRIEFKYVRPLSFGEYLDASGNHKLREYMKTIHIHDTIEDVVHSRLLTLLREYCSLGGMPAVIAEYLQTKNLQRCGELQTAVLSTYRNDFGKYAKHTQHALLQTIFTKAPALVSEWLKYTKLDPDTPAKAVKGALLKLCDAGLIILVHATSGSGIPFTTDMNEKKSKMLFLDIGLVKKACHLDLDLLFKKDLLLINNGALAEQLVGQELLSYMGKEEKNNLFFWAREQKSSSAEIDYLIAVDSHIIPLEVKSRSTGSLRSLKIFLEEKKLPLGVRISEVPFSFEKSLLTIPLYLIEQLPRLVQEAYTLL